MPYTGEVTPGGPADSRTAGDLVITKVAVDPEMSNNCYLLRCVSTGDQVLIDAAAEPATLLPLIGDAGLTTVVTTHQHWDHHRALADVVVAPPAPRSWPGLPTPTPSPSRPACPSPARSGDGDTVEVGGCALSVIAIVGHTPGSIALVYDDPDGHRHLFTGDSLFPGGVGNTRGDKDNFRSLIDDVETKIFGTLPDDTWFYPGHGNDSTLGVERPHLAEWRERGW